MGTGIARGFLAAFDTVWSIKQLASGVQPLKILSERESVFQLLSQTKHENMSKNMKQYSIDPKTRYPNLNTSSIQESQVEHLYELDYKCPPTTLKEVAPKPVGELKLAYNERKPLKVEQIFPKSLETMGIERSVKKKDHVALKINPHQDVCHVCDENVYMMEKKTVMKYILHRKCFKCHYCERGLSDNLYKYQNVPQTNKCKSRYICSNIDRI